MIRGAMSASGTAAMYFLPAKTTINKSRYLNLLHEIFKLKMDIHRRSILIHGVSSSHRAMTVKNYLEGKENAIFFCPGKLPRFNSIQFNPEEFMCAGKNEFRKMQLPSTTVLVQEYSRSGVHRFLKHASILLLLACLTGFQQWFETKDVLQNAYFI